MAGTAPSGLNLGVVMGPDFREMSDNLVRNLRGIVSPVVFGANAELKPLEFPKFVNEQMIAESCTPKRDN